MEWAGGDFHLDWPLKLDFLLDQSEEESFLYDDSSISQDQWDEYKIVLGWSLLRIR